MRLWVNIGDDHSIIRCSCNQSGSSPNILTQSFIITARQCCCLFSTAPKAKKGPRTVPRTNEYSTSKVHIVLLHNKLFFDLNSSVRYHTTTTFHKHKQIGIIYRSIYLSPPLQPPFTVIYRNRMMSRKFESQGLGSSYARAQDGRIS